MKIELLKELEQKIFEVEQRLRESVMRLTVIYYEEKIRPKDMIYAKSYLSPKKFLEIDKDVCNLCKTTEVDGTDATDFSLQDILDAFPHVDASSVWFKIDEDNYRIILQCDKLDPDFEAKVNDYVEKTNLSIKENEEIYAAKNVNIEKKRLEALLEKYNLKAVPV